MTFSRVLSVTAIVFAAWAAGIPPASAQFGGMPGMPGMGMPGMGGPGFGAPPPTAGPPPACQQLIALRDDFQKNGNALNAVGEKARAEHKPPDPAETCKLFKNLLASHAKFLRGMTQNQATCGVPPDAIKASQEQRGRYQQMEKQICDAAEHPRQNGPTLSDALNSAPTLPDVDNTKRGQGTYDTIDGTNPFAR